MFVLSGCFFVWLGVFFLFLDFVVCLWLLCLVFLLHVVCLGLIVFIVLFDPCSFSDFEKSPDTAAIYATEPGSLREIR